MNQTIPGPTTHIIPVALDRYDPNYSVNPNWDTVWIYVQFDRHGDACALQNRYARKAMEYEEDYIFGVHDDYQYYLEKHGPYSVLTLKCWEELRKYYSDPDRDTKYLDPVYLGPYQASKPGIVFQEF